METRVGDLLNEVFGHSSGGVQQLLELSVVLESLLQLLRHDCGWEVAGSGVPLVLPQFSRPVLWLLQHHELEGLSLHLRQV